MVQSDQQMEQRRDGQLAGLGPGVPGQGRGGGGGMAIWICEKNQSIIKPTPTSLGPVQRRGFGGGLALALGIDNCRSAGGQGGRGVWAQP